MDAARQGKPCSRANTRRAIARLFVQIKRSGALHLNTGSAQRDAESFLALARDALLATRARELDVEDDDDGAQPLVSAVARYAESGSGAPKRKMSALDLPGVLPNTETQYGRESKRLKSANEPSRGVKAARSLGSSILSDLEEEIAMMGVRKICNQTIDLTEADSASNAINDPYDSGLLGDGPVGLTEDTANEAQDTSQATDDAVDGTEDPANDTEEVDDLDDDPGANSEKAKKQLGPVPEAFMLPLTADERASADELAAHGPKTFWRIQSAGKEGCIFTLASATDNYIKPAASANWRPVYSSISDFPTKGELVRNLGDHALWRHKLNGQFTSYTTSLTFALVYAQCLTAKGEKSITITPIDAGLAKALNGSRARFYHMPTFQRILGSSEFRGKGGWSSKEAAILLSPRFEHEYVALGDIILDKNPYRPVKYRELLDAGLAEHMPQLFREADEGQMQRLYQRILHVRALTYEADATPIDNAYIAQAESFARMFSRPGDCMKPGSLRLFLDFIALTNRRQDSLSLKAFVRKQWDSDDVRELQYKGMHHIANNLPEAIQFMDRFRETCEAVGIHGPAETIIEQVDKTRFSATGHWIGSLDTLYLTRTVRPSAKTTYSPEEIQNKAKSQAQTTLLAKGLLPQALEQAKQTLLDPKGTAVSHPVAKTESEVAQQSGLTGYLVGYSSSAKKWLTWPVPAYCPEDGCGLHWCEKTSCEDRPRNAARRKELTAELGPKKTNRKAWIAVNYKERKAWGRAGRDWKPPKGERLVDVPAMIKAGVLRPCDQDMPNGTGKGSMPQRKGKTDVIQSTACGRLFLWLADGTLSGGIGWDLTGSG